MLDALYPPLYPPQKWNWQKWNRSLICSLYVILLAISPFTLSQKCLKRMKISVFKCEGFVVSTFHLCPWCEHFDFFAWKAPHQYPSPKHPPFSPLHKSFRTFIFLLLFFHASNVCGSEWCERLLYLILHIVNSWKSVVYIYFVNGWTFFWGLNYVYRKITLVFFIDLYFYFIFRIYPSLLRRYYPIGCTISCHEGAKALTFPFFF